MRSASAIRPLLALALLQAGLAFAEQSDNSNAGSSDSNDEFLPSPEITNKSVALVDDNAQPRTFGLWDSAEHLLWWIKSDHVPPLVTAGGNGVIDAPGTRVLLED